MLRIIVLTFSLVWLLQIGSTAQYTNTDSLVIVAGFQDALPISVLDSIEIHSPEILPGLYKPGNISSGQLFSLFSLPGKGKVISRFGLRSGRMHTGTDIKMSHGDTIYAVFDGIVTKSTYYYGYGNMVAVSHGNGLETRYAHLSKYLARTGQAIARGEPVGLAGATGRATTCHLHFEIREFGRPYDPELVYDFENKTIKPSVIHTDRLTHVVQASYPDRNTPNNSFPEHHRVRNGDSLWKISRKYRTTINSLCRLNNLTENSVLQIGQVIRLY